MDAEIIVVFDNEKNAYEGARVLKELHSEGSITLYASAMISKDAGGKVIVKRTTDRGPLRTGVGSIIGSGIGLLNDPVSVANGAGTFGGTLNEFAKVGVGEDFLEEIGQYLTPGKVAVVAEIWEEWVIPVDTRMEAVGGVVFRRMHGEVQDSLIERDAAAFKVEIADLKAKHAKANLATKANIQAKIKAAKAKLQVTQDRAKAAEEVTEQEMEAKIKSVKEQLTKAQGAVKAKLGARIAELQSDHKRRADKLHQAWELSKDALTL